MSWAIAGNWVAVAGLLLLTIGTRAQARASLAEFNKLKRELIKRRREMVETIMGIAELATDFAIIGLPAAAIYTVKNHFRYLFVSPETLEGIRAQDGDEAVDLARLSQQSLIWTILNLGATLALVAAAIQLALSYQ
jgi:hypothetical protein